MSDVRRPNLVDHIGTPLAPVKVGLSTEEARQGLAFHEAGHTVLCIAYGMHVVRTGIVTWWDKSGPMNTGGSTSWEADSVSLYDIAVQCAAGEIAQMRHLHETGRLTSDTARAAHAEHDREKAVALLAEAGISLVSGNAAAGEMSWHEIYATAEQRVDRLWPQISAVAAALTERELTGDQAAEIAGMTNPKAWTS